MKLIKTSSNKLLLIIILIFTSSCSLLKLSIDSNEIPLSKNLLNMRIAVRAFQTDFSSSIIKATDSIMLKSKDVEIKLNIIQFKRAIIAASAKTAYQSTPELSLIDTWILCKQLTAILNTNKAREYLGHNKELIFLTAIELETKISGIAKSFLNAKRFVLLETFALNYAKKTPINTFYFPRTNILTPLSKYLGISDSTYVQTLGTGVQALGDIGDRIAIAKEQISQQVTWEKDRLSLEWENSEISDDFLRRADSLNAILDKFAHLAENSPELMEAITLNIKEELMPLIQELNGGLNTSVDMLSTERIYLQSYLDNFQKKVIEDLNYTGERLIEKSTSSIAKLIKDVAWIVILALIVIILLIFGIPFMAGYYLAKARFKK